MREHKAWLMGQRGRLVDATGTRRRIQALLRLGWTLGEIAEACGRPSGRNWTHAVMSASNRVHIDTHRRIAAAYDAMSMTIPEGKYRSRNRATAEAKGYLPPLAWNRIDDPDEMPRGVTAHPPSPDDIDEVVVDRLLQLQQIPSTRAEKEEAMRRWIASGRSETSFCDAHGWRSGRYLARAKEAS